MKMMIIAIDGPSASGKGTLAKMIGQHYNLAHLETGLLYRAIAGNLLERKISIQDKENFMNEAAMVARVFARSMDMKFLKNIAFLESDEVAQAASIISAHPDVRQGLLEFQRFFAHNPPLGRDGSVLDGRDIGTVICPEAHVKFFIEAPVEIRAKRRYEQLKDGGKNQASLEFYNELLTSLKERDNRDRSRTTAPMKAAMEAHRVHNTEDAQTTFDAMRKIIDEYIKTRK